MLLVVIAGHAAAIAAAPLPAEATAAAKQAVLDCLGVTLAGARAASVVALKAAIASPQGGIPLIGTDEAVPMLDAALINGTAAHALDFDDASNTIGGHPTAPMLPAILAVATERHADGRAILAAYVAGFETQAAVARAFGAGHSDAGFHPTGTVGIFGAAAASGILLHLTDEQLAHALGIAASLASGVRGNFGSPMKAVHAGNAARQGLLAALMAAQGITANLDLAERGGGFFAASPPAQDFASLDLVATGLSFKQHPCCGATHAAIDILLDLRSRFGLTPDDVERLEVETHPRRYDQIDRPNPRDGFDATFSLTYVLARALIAGQVGLGDFTEPAIFACDARSLMTRITTRPSDTLPGRGHLGARLRVVLKDGRVLVAEATAPLGRDKAHPLPPGALQAKFRDCAGRALAPPRVAELERVIGNLEAMSSIDSLNSLLRSEPETTRKST